MALFSSLSDLQNIAIGIILLIANPEMRNRFIQNGYEVLAKKFEKSYCVQKWVEVLNC